MMVKVSRQKGGGMRYRRNVGLAYAFSLSLSLSFTHGIWMIFLASQGFSLVQLGLLEAIFHVTSFLMEVPTGSVADIWGRKASRIAGRLCYALSLIFMFHSTTFLLQVVAFILSALGYNLESGAGDALLYDSLLLDGEEGRYIKVKGNDELINQIGSILSFLLGGYLASLDFGIAFYATAGSALAGFCIALFFIEPELEKGEKRKKTSVFNSVLISLKSQILDSGKVFKKKPRIGFFILFSESLFAFMVCLFFYLQNHWTNLGFSPATIGVVFSLHAAIAAIFSVKAHAIEKRIGQRGLLVGCPLMLLVTLWGVALTPYSMVFYVLCASIEGLLIPTISTYLNQLIPSKFRATILSFQSMAYSLFMIAIFPLVGFVGNVASLNHAFVLLSALATLLVIPYLVMLSKQKR
jgi:MFS family permease